MSGPGTGVANLRTAQAVRERAALVAQAVLRGDSRCFSLDEHRLPEVAALVAEETRRNYPALQIPAHSRWRHFVVGGDDRFERCIAPALAGDARERARASLDLIVTSVLLDAGAGGAWRYMDRHTGAPLVRSEGLAIASLDLFADGLLSSAPHGPLRADAEALCAVETPVLARAFQVEIANPLAGLEGRAALMRSLGDAVARRSDLFGGGRPRIGHLFDRFERIAQGGALSANTILTTLLDAFAPIWPNGESLDGEPLGDVWRHRAAQTANPPALVPFHKLSQWLCYSVIESLQRSSVTVVDTDALTGLAEYRNGGLFVDAGVVRPIDEGAFIATHSPGDELIVEWRALTVYLLERLRPLVAEALGLDALPMAQLLQGGTWSAGRRLAYERSPEGSPPFSLRSDGTVF
ncbi:MAG: DUF1688 family protein [Gammaproteobacteria bacterium]